jgi:hypothetical protein
VSAASRRSPGRRATGIARATSGFFLFAYFGFSLPVVLTGFLADAAGLMMALWLFGGMLVLANGVIGILLRRERAIA